MSSSVTARSVGLIALLFLPVGAYVAWTNVDPAHSKAREHLQLVGEYRLVINPGQVVKGGLGELSSSLESESLLLHADGSFEQECRFRSGERFRAEKRSWRFDGNVVFSMIKDCSGFLGRNGEETAASLVVEFGKPNLILLHPDVNVYYEHVKQGPA